MTELEECKNLLELLLLILDSFLLIKTLSSTSLKKIPRS